MFIFFQWRTAKFNFRTCTTQFAFDSSSSSSSKKAIIGRWVGGQTVEDVWMQAAVFIFEASRGPDTPAGPQFVSLTPQRLANPLPSPPHSSSPHPPPPTASWPAALMLLARCPAAARPCELHCRELRVQSRQSRRNGIRPFWAAAFLPLNGGHRTTPTATPPTVSVLRRGESPGATRKVGKENFGVFLLSLDAPS